MTVSRLQRDTARSMWGPVSLDHAEKLLYVRMNPQGSLYAAAHIDLPKDIVEVSSDGMAADEETGGDLTVMEAACHQEQNVKLPRAQGGDSLTDRGRFPAS